MESFRIVRTFKKKKAILNELDALNIKGEVISFQNASIK